MSDALTSTKLKQTGKKLGQQMLSERMGICVLSPAHESEMWGYLVYLLIVKYFLLIPFKLSHSVSDWPASSWNFKNISRGFCGPYYF